MYLKLMFRNLLRYSKRGRRLFVLIALCSAALVFLLAFQSDFLSRSQDQYTGLLTGHLQVLPPDSPLLTNAVLPDQTEEVPLLRLGAEFDAWLAGLPQVEVAAPVITRIAMTYNLDSTPEWGFYMMAVPAKHMAALFPMASLTEGSGDISWEPGTVEVPVVCERLATEFGQENQDSSHFVAKEIKEKDDSLPAFMGKLASDFPSVFTSAPYKTIADIDRFLSDWSKALAISDLPALIPAQYLREYDWRIDDAIVAIRENQNPNMASFLNKGLFKALYPDEIVNLAEPRVVGKQVSLQVSPFVTTGATSLPTIIPARYVGMCQFDVIYGGYSFIDLGAFRHFMALGENDATSWFIRLKDIKDTDAVKALIEGKLSEMGSDAKVVDYKYLGKDYAVIGLAISAILVILIIVFMLILLLFILNLVVMSMKRRKKEIGTGFALGLSPMQTVVIMLGEIGVIVSVSCFAGLVIGLFLILMGVSFGIPGMVFLIGGKLNMTLQASPFIATYLMLLLSSLIVAFFPLARLRKTLPVDLLKEAN